MVFTQEQLDAIASRAKGGPVTLETKREKSELRKKSERVLGGALKAIDFIERPYYALMNVGVDYYGGDEGFSPFAALGRGLAGKEKSDFNDVLTEAGWEPETRLGKIGKGGVGFVGGVLMDPITYLTFGTGKGIQLGGKILSKDGTKQYLKLLSKKTGQKFNKIDDLSKLGTQHTEIYEQTSKEFLDKAWENPDIFFNKTAMRFAGQEIPKSQEFLSGIGKTFNKALEPILSTKVARESERTGKLVTKSLGEMFSPGYDIRHSRNLNPKQKSELLFKLEETRSLTSLSEANAINETRKVFKDLGKKEREQVVFETEKLLKLGQKGTTDETINKIIKDVRKIREPSVKTTSEFAFGEVDPLVLVERGDYAEALRLSRKIGNRAEGKKVMSEVRAKVAEDTFNNQNLDAAIRGIKNEKVRKVVDQFNNRMRQLWDDEVNQGLRKRTDSISSGYVKRKLVKVANPEDVNRGFFNTRKQGIPTIEQAKKEYEAGTREWMFETDAAKVYAERVNQSGMIGLRKQLITWMTGKGFAKKAGKTPTQGMTQVKLWGKFYETTPEIARELQRVAPQLTDTGMKSFLKTYDKIQGTWKLSVTSLFPSFHARNAVSNVWLGWLGGNKNPETYRQALKLQWYGNKIKRGQKVKDETIKIGKRSFKLSELWKMGGESGVIGTGWMGGEFTRKLALNKGDLSFWTRAPKRLGTAVENNARIAMLLDRLGKGDDLFSAATHTKKFLFDYGDLTDFEKNVMKRIIPFYTWMRKNIALQLDQITKQPGKYTAMLHAQKGIESMSPADEEKFLPEWMREEELYVRLPGKKYFNPDLPFQDLAKLTLSDRTVREIVNPITPLIKGLFEIAANKDIFRGKPLADQRLPKNRFAREKIKKELLNNLRFSTVFKRATDEDRGKLDKFLNLLLGINVTAFDSAQGRRIYRARKVQERKAERKLEQKEK